MKSLIFLVDENRNQLSALERAISSVEEFELAGMTSDGEECIRQLEGKHVHVLVLDMILPKKDGFYVLEEIRSRRLQVDHIICISSYLSEMILSEFNRYCVDYIMMKPYEIPDLIRKIHFIRNYQPDYSQSEPASGGNDYRAAARAWGSCKPERVSVSTLCNYADLP